MPLPKPVPVAYLEAIRRRLSYDPHTGKLHWMACGAAWIKAGDEAGALAKHGGIHIGLRVDGKCRFFKAHHIAWFLSFGEWPTQGIDHRDGNDTNNKIENLRYATQQQNGRNRPHQANNKLRVKGVHWSETRRKFVAAIKSDKQTSLGRFDTLEEAKAARDAAELKYHGEFASSLREKTA